MTLTTDTRERRTGIADTVSFTSRNSVSEQSVDSDRYEQTELVQTSTAFPPLQAEVSLEFLAVWLEVTHSVHDIDNRGAVLHRGCSHLA